MIKDKAKTRLRDTKKSMVKQFMYSTVVINKHTDGRYRKTSHEREAAQISNMTLQPAAATLCFVSHTIHYYSRSNEQQYSSITCSKIDRNFDYAAKTMEIDGEINDK